MSAENINDFIIANSKELKDKAVTEGRKGEMDILDKLHNELFDPDRRAHMGLALSAIRGV